MSERDNRIWICATLSFRIQARRATAIKDAINYLRDIEGEPRDYIWKSGGSGFTITVRSDGSIYCSDKWSQTNNLT